MQRFHNVLVAIDTRFETQPALPYATQLAEHNKAKLKLIDVVPEFSWLARWAMPNHEQMQQTLVQEKSRHLEALAGPLRDKGLEVTTKVLSGKTSFAIMREVLSNRHDLVVRVTKGAESRRTGFFGTTSLRLLRQCPCPVWLVRPDREARFQRVLAAIGTLPADDAHEQLNKSIMDLALSIAKYEGGQCHVVHAWELFGKEMVRVHWPGDYVVYETKAEAQVAKTLNAFLEPYGLNARSPGVHLLCGDTADMIARCVKQENIDLLVMGTIGRTGIPGMFIGNTAERALEHVECSVLALKPEGYISPARMAAP